MRRLAALLVGGALMLAAETRIKVSRPALQVMEKSFDRKVAEFSIDDPLLPLGATRGVYLENYGVVFTTELNLVTAVITPFRPSYSKEQLALLREKKLKRLPLLKQAMQEALMNWAALLDALPDQEQVVLVVLLMNSSWEDTTGLPSQVMMQAAKKTLLDLRSNRGDKMTLLSSIRTQEN